jgi:hypothetical protein
MVALRRTHVLAAGLVVAVGAVAAAAVKPSGAATAPAEVVTLADVSLSPKLEEIVTKVAGIGDVPTDAILAVTPQGADTRAGVFVARDRGGAEVVAPYNDDGMMGFASIDRVAAHGGVMVFPSAFGDVGVVERVSVVGIVSARVAEVELALLDGAVLKLELVAAGRAGFRFFAYTASDEARFPSEYVARDGTGRVVKREDLSRALEPPGR